MFSSVRPSASSARRIGVVRACHAFSKANLSEDCLRLSSIHLRQRRCILQPRVGATQECLPWVNVTNRNNLNEVVAVSMRERRDNEVAATALRLEILADDDPG